MKRIFTLLIAAFAFVACGTFDDSEIWDRLDEYGETIKDHESRIAALEELCKQMNTNLESLQTIVEALENRDYITNVAPVTKDGAVVGYVISFAASETITIYHGEDGKDGSNGADGADGKDGSAPQIGVKQDSDGVYYWTINGEWLLDAQGNKVRATGEDGEKGEDGAVPKLKIENDKWFISYDEGATWLELGDATGEDGDNIFANVTYDDEFVYFEMTNGATITIPFSDKSDSNDTIENHKIYYTTSDNQKLFPNNTEPKIFNAILVSNTYENGVGVLLFDDTVTAIGELAFSDCDSLTSVTIPDSVTTIGEGAFKDCTGELYVNCNISFYNSSVFYGSKFTSITIGDGVTTIGEGAFSSCDNLTSVTIPDSVTTIGDYAFSGCDSLTSVTIPDSVTTIGDAAFCGCSSLTSVTIPDSVTAIGEDAFEYCNSLTSVYITDLSAWCNINFAYSCANPLCCANNLYLNGELVTNLIIPDSVTTIGEYAFYNCDSLTSIIIPDSVTTIGDAAFSGCDSLTSIFIPDSVTTIGEYAFYDCDSLTSVCCEAITPPAGGSYMFDSNDWWRKIFVPKESVEDYKSAEYWSWYADAIIGYDF